jgi:hypothetical protein
MTSADDVSERTDFAGIKALQSREAGYAVALKCLEVQTKAQEADPTLKTDTRTTLHPDAWAWYTGALGEMEVGRMLAELGPEWFVRHSVPIGAGTKDVDHLVIGPAGIFAINTKHHRGASIWVGDHVLRVNNANTHHLPRAMGDAADVARRLALRVGFPINVTPVVAVLGAQSLSDRRTPMSRRVQVVSAERLVAWLNSQPKQLGEATLGLIRLAAEEPETWHVDPRRADTLRVMQRFERLVAQVGDPQHAAGHQPRRTSAPVSRRPRTSAPRTTRKPASRPPKRATTSPADLIKLWFGTALILTAIFVIRGVADRPCTSPIACVFPPIYLAFRPILDLGVGITILGCVIGTLVLIARLVRK